MPYLCRFILVIFIDICSWLISFHAADTKVDKEDLKSIGTFFPPDSHIFCQFSYIESQNLIHSSLAWIGKNFR